MTDAGPTSVCSNPLVSVVMVNRDKAPYVGEALRSVWEQGVRDVELLIADNGSRDASEREIKGHSKGAANCRAWFWQEPVGIFSATNWLLNRAKGRYIARLDSDDVWLPGKLERQLEVLESDLEEAIGVCGTNARVINEKGEIRWEKRFPEKNAGIVSALRWRNPFCHSSAVIRGRCFREMGGYDEEFACAGDLELWFRLSQRYAFYNIQGPLTDYRIGSGNVSLERHRKVVGYTLLARKRARERYGFESDAVMRGMDAIIWGSQFVPPNLAFHVFNRLVLR